MTLSLRERREQASKNGEAAFREGKPITECPHPEDSAERSGWSQGWWKAFYHQRDQDTERIAQWVYRNVMLFKTYRQAESLAQVIVATRDYNRSKPIEDNRLAGESFRSPRPLPSN